jgi:hypothetical protein
MFLSASPFPHIQIYAPRQRSGTSSITEAVQAMEISQKQWLSLQAQQGILKWRLRQEASSWVESQIKEIESQLNDLKAKMEPYIPIVQENGYRLTFLNDPSSPPPLICLFLLTTTYTMKP